MDLEYSTVKELKIYDSVVREQPLETDIVMPEYFPAIGRILKCFVLPDEEAVTVSDGKISVAGTATVKLLYTDDEQKLHCYRTETKYTKVLQSDSCDEKCAVKVTQNTVTLNYRALGPKRVEVKACVAVKADIYAVCQTNVISSADSSAELLCAEKEYSEAVCVYCRELTSKESVHIEKTGKKAVAVISAQVFPVVEKTEIISNKIMLKGRNDIKLICCTEDDLVECTDISVPFTDVADCYGIDENSSCNIQFYCNEADVEIENDTGDTFGVTVKNKLFIFGCRKSSIKYVEDAYALRAESECKYSSPVIACDITQLREEERISAETELFEDGIFSVVAAFADGITFSVGRRDGETVIEGTVCINILAADNDGRYSLVSKKAAIEHKLPDGMRCIGCNVSVKGIGADIASSGKINLSCVLGFNMLAQKCEKVKALTEFSIGERKNSVSRERAIIYFAEKGERVWDIAKENKTTVANIRENNDVGDVIEANMKLVFTDF